MQGSNIAEMGHIVNILPPIDITSGDTGDVFSMENYAHATIIVQVGVSAGAFTKIILNECNTIEGGDATAIAHSIYKEETALGDILGARSAVLVAGTTPGAADGIFYVIELDAAELSDGYNFVQLSVTNTVNSVIASAVAILSGSRYGGTLSKTAIA